LSDGYSLERLRTAVDTGSQNLPDRSIDEIDSARAREYALLATLLSHSPDMRLLSGLAGLPVDTSPIGLAHSALAEAARQATEAGVAREYVALFGGLGGSALLPYASHYLADTLYGRPLARLRQTLQPLGVEKAPERIEPEDHASFLCEIMAGASCVLDQAFFRRSRSGQVRGFLQICRDPRTDFHGCGDAGFCALRLNTYCCPNHEGLGSTNVL
jgi:TorA maturation chaperone TorD